MKFFKGHTGIKEGWLANIYYADCDRHAVFAEVTRGEVAPNNQVSTA